MARYDPTLAHIAEHYGGDAVDETQAGDARAALVLDISQAMVQADEDGAPGVTPTWGDLAEAALAVVEAAGWRPPATPLTGAQVTAIARDVRRTRAHWWFDTEGVRAEDVTIVETVLSHPLVAARGVRLDGGQG